jgi:hypothetical protein
MSRYNSSTVPSTKIHFWPFAVPAFVRKIAKIAKAVASRE